MKNTVKAILAGGPPAVLTTGAGIMYAQHELHYLLRPSVVETIAGIAALGGAVLWSKRSKAPTPPTTEHTEHKMVVWEPVEPPKALPPATPLTPQQRGEQAFTKWIQK